VSGIDVRLLNEPRVLVGVDLIGQLLLGLLDLAVLTHAYESCGCVGQPLPGTDPTSPP
jgi:hypothetical protein